MHSFTRILSLMSIVSTLAIASSAFATDLNCELIEPIQSGIGSIESFNLKNIEGGSEQLDSDLPDQSTLTPFDFQGKNLSAAFSNQCDNMYIVSIKQSDVLKLQEGRRSSVRGKLVVQAADQRTEYSQIICRQK